VPVSFLWHFRKATSVENAPKNRRTARAIRKSKRPSSAFVMIRTRMMRAEATIAMKAAQRWYASGLVDVPGEALDASC